MKKVIVMLTLGVMVAGSSFAQNAPQKDRKNRTEQRGERGDKARKSPEEIATLRTEKLSKKLDLNNSQTKKLQALNLKQANEMQAMRTKYKDADRRNPKQREEMKAVHAKWEAELKDILNKKQYAQYEADRNEMRARWEKRGQQHKDKDFKGREFRQSERS
ncbi:DUF4890 domain-containing protein [Pontibacter silvestris]|uniref:DUF4890 domain-containing protein n=1 Tax=Pontibacter silvestris TaxID=2305183 RepID=A0ABW4WWW5_9BACT|nr:DUF4890 domain-containing protein [Pontibacter silvestris]MCC9136454.1 DUF4890 domain-containing protein [Pontibacter silvestris]